MGEAKEKQRRMQSLTSQPRVLSWRVVGMVVAATCAVLGLTAYIAGMLRSCTRLMQEDRAAEPQPQPAGRGHDRGVRGKEGRVFQLTYTGRGRDDPDVWTFEDDAAGLGMARQVASAHGGTVVVEGGGGSPTVVRLTIPLEAGLAMPKEAPAAANVRAKARIFLCMVGTSESRTALSR